MFKKAFEYKNIKYEIELKYNIIITSEVDRQMES